MTLIDLLARQHSRLGDAASPKLHVSRGAMSDEEEEYVMSEEYGGNVYCYVTNLDNAEVQVYDNGTARFIYPVDVIFEAPDDTEPAALSLHTHGLTEALRYVNELRPGVRLASPLRRVGGSEPESLRKGFVQASVRVQSSWA